jgi:hypothetical protein
MNDEQNRTRIAHAVFSNYLHRYDHHETTIPLGYSYESFRPVIVGTYAAAVARDLPRLAAVIAHEHAAPATDALERIANTAHPTNALAYLYIDATSRYLIDHPDMPEDDRQVCYGLLQYALNV